MNKWFDDVFLPSLLARSEATVGMWLTRRQTAICVQNMKRHTALHAQLQGDYVRHDYYTLEWRGRSVRLDYSKLNGCGTIVFGFTKEEQERHAAKCAEERKRVERERMERRKSSPERLARWIERTRKSIADAEYRLASAYEALDDARAENDTDDMEYISTLIESVEGELDALKKELAWYME